MKISLFGKEFEIKARAPAIATCGNCEGGLVNYYRFRNGYPYTYVALCDCPLGKAYHYLGADPKTGKEIKCFPSWPRVDSDEVRILDHNHYPRCQSVYEENLKKEEAPEVPKTDSLLGKEANNR